MANSDYIWKNKKTYKKKEKKNDWITNGSARSTRIFWHQGVTNLQQLSLLKCYYRIWHFDFSAQGLHRLSTGFTSGSFSCCPSIYRFILKLFISTISSVQPQKSPWNRIHQIVRTISYYNTESEFDTKRFSLLRSGFTILTIYYLKSLKIFYLPESSFISLKKFCSNISAITLFRLMYSYLPYFN